MPSVSGSTSEASVQSRESSFGSEEMEDLMKRITDSLRLKASCKQKVHAQRGLQRTTPYTLPTPKKYLKCQKQCKYHKSRYSSEKSCSDDPHELLKNLLRDRSLIAEAVRRLQCKLDEALLTNRISASDCVYDYEDNDFVCS